MCSKRSERAVPLREDESSEESSFDMPRFHKTDATGQRASPKPDLPTNGSLASMNGSDPISGIDFPTRSITTGMAFS